MEGITQIICNAVVVEENANVVIECMKDKFLGQRITVIQMNHNFCRVDRDVHLEFVELWRSRIVAWSDSLSLKTMPCPFAVQISAGGVMLVQFEDQGIHHDWMFIAEGQ